MAKPPLPAAADLAAFTLCHVSDENLTPDSHNLAP